MTTTKDKSPEGPYKVEPVYGYSESVVHMISGPTPIAGYWEDEIDANHERDNFNAAYAKGYAAGQEDRHPQTKEAEAMCGDHGGIEGCSCSLCSTPLGPVELTAFCNGCGARVKWPLANGGEYRALMQSSRTKDLEARCDELAKKVKALEFALGEAHRAMNYRDWGIYEKGSLEHNAFHAANRIRNPHHY